MAVHSVTWVIPSEVAGVFIADARSPDQRLYTPPRSTLRMLGQNIELRILSQPEPTRFSVLFGRKKPKGNLRFAIKFQPIPQGGLPNTILARLAADSTIGLFKFQMEGKENNIALPLLKTQAELEKHRWKDGTLHVQVTFICLEPIMAKLATKVEQEALLRVGGRLANLKGEEKLDVETMTSEELLLIEMLGAIKASGEPQWQPDSDSTCCTSCQVEFTMIRRRHHCRMCGKLKCGRCCPKRQGTRFCYECLTAAVMKMLAKEKEKE